MIYIAKISTVEGKRIAKRLYNHWKHKFEVQETEYTLTIHLPNAQLTMTPETDHLTLELDVTAEDAPRLQNIVLDHLNRMAQQEFETHWYTK